MTEKCIEKRNFITILNYLLSHKLYDLALLRISIIFSQAINNHCLVLHTHISFHKFQEQFDDKFTKLSVKPFSEQSRITLNS